MWKFFIFLLTIVFPVQIFSQISKENEIMRIYYDAVYKNILDKSCLNILQSVDSTELTTYSDSAQYCYHYVYAALMEMQEHLDIRAQSEHLRRAVEICEKNIGIIDIEYIDILKKLGENTQALADDKAAMDYYQQALVKGSFLLERKDLSRMRLTRGTILDNLGVIYINLGHKREGIACFKSASGIMKDDYAADDQTAIMPSFHLAKYYLSDNQFEASIATCDDILSFMKDKGITEGELYEAILNIRTISANHLNQKNK